jgi:hypothetical protein
VPAVWFSCMKTGFSRLFRARRLKEVRLLVLHLPRLAGTRPAADDLLAEYNVPGDLSGQAVVLQCRDLSTGSASYADQLVLRLLVMADAKQMTLVAPPQKFLDRVQASADRRNVADRVVVETAGQVAV